MPTRMTSSSRGTIFVWTFGEAERLYAQLEDIIAHLEGDVSAACRPAAGEVVDRAQAAMRLMDSRTVSPTVDRDIGAGPIPGVAMSVTRSYNAGSWLLQREWEDIQDIITENETLSADPDACLRQGDPVGEVWLGEGEDITAEVAARTAAFDELIQGMGRNEEGEIVFTSNAWMAAQAGATAGGVSGPEPLDDLEVADPEAFDQLLEDLAGGATAGDVARLSTEEREDVLEAAMTLGIVRQEGGDWRQIATGFGVTVGVLGLGYLAWRAGSRKGK